MMQMESKSLSEVETERERSGAMSFISGLKNCRANAIDDMGRHLDVIIV